jgi:hypothetical protein
MSEQINRVLVDRPQSFTTGEQLQARTNIGAQASGDYAYNSSVSAKQDASAMSSYVPFSAISADAASAITSINGSSVGNFTGVSSNGNLSGDGTSGSPVGLRDTVTLSAGGGASKTYLSAGSVTISSMAFPALSVYSTESASSRVDSGGLHVKHTASGAGGGVATNTYGESLQLKYNGGEYYLREISSDASGLKMLQLGNTAKVSMYGFGSAQFSDDTGTTWETVDPQSIRKWNGYGSSQWNESANSLGTGFAGNPAVSAAQYNYGGAHSNWSCREVYADGIPGQQLYGFQVTPGGDTSRTYTVRGDGHFVDYQQTYFPYIFRKTGAAVEDLGSSFYPTGLTANARLDFVNMSQSRMAQIMTDTYHGTTAIVGPGESKTVYYLASVSAWSDGANAIPD